MNRIGRRTIFCMMLIVALAIVWNLLGHRKALLTSAGAPRGTKVPGGREWL